LGLLAFALYGPTLSHPFIYDDRTLIAQNPFLKDLTAIPSLFITDLWSGLAAPRSVEGTAADEEQTAHRRYRPLLMASYALNHAAGGTDPFGYHLVNVLLHAAATALLYLVALELGWSHLGAFVAGLVFALHPLHSEAVAWVVGRPEMMMAVGMLGALWCHARGLRAWAMAAFLFGLFSKEQAVMLPALIMLADACAGRLARSERASWRALVGRYGGYVLLLGLFLALRTAVLGGFQPARYPLSENPLEHVDGAMWLLSVLKMAGHYLRLSLWPAVLSIDYSYDALPLARSVLEPGVLWAAMAWGGLAGLAAWGWRRDRRITLAVGLTILTFLPAANVLVPLGTPVAERVFYLPLGGLCLLVGLLPEHLSLRETSHRRWPVGAALAVGLATVLALTGRTLVRLQDWRSNETLFRSAVAVVPSSARAHFLLGSELLDQREPAAVAEGLKELEQALAIYPAYVRDDPVFASNLGIALLQFERYEEAARALESAVAKWPGWKIPYHHLGFAYVKLAQPDKAVEAWRTNLKLAPDDMLVRLRLSRLLVQQGRHEEGLKEAEAAIARDPEYASAHYHRGWALQGLGRLDEARAAYDHVLAMPNAPEVAKTEAVRRLLELLQPGVSRKGRLSS
jgi:tetratricopeptide (TPR) repeat protein